jgi:hypothetical protein
MAVRPPLSEHACVMASSHGLVGGGDAPGRSHRMVLPFCLSVTITIQASE